MLNNNWKYCFHTILEWDIKNPEFDFMEIGSRLYDGSADFPVVPVD